MAFTKSFIQFRHLQVLYLVSLLCALQSECLAESFYLQGQIKNAKQDYSIIISYPLQDSVACIERQVDTLLLHNGRFYLSGDVEGLRPAIIEINRHRYRFYLEPGTLTLEIDGNRPLQVQETGTSVDDELALLNHYTIENDSMLFYWHQKALDWVYITEYDFDDVAEYDKWCQKRKDLLLEFCNAHVGFKIVPDLLCQVLEIDKAGSLEKKPFEKIKTIKSLSKRIPEEVISSPMGRILQNSLRIAECAAKAQRHPVGALMPNISFTMIDGQCQRISDYRDSKYVLLHVWSDYCYNCELEIIAIENFRHRFTKNLEIISISRLEQSKDEWTKSLERCQIDWVQTMDTWYTELYQIYSPQIVSLLPCSLLPCFILIDMDGKIVDFEEGNLKYEGLFSDHW